MDGFKNMIRTFTTHYTLLDWATQGYIAAVGLLILIFHNETVPFWYLLVFIHVIGIVFVQFIIHKGSSSNSRWFWQVLRLYYPVLLFTGFYRETGLINRMFIGEFLDPWFIRLEESIFGFQPAILFMEKFPFRYFAELMYASYFSYYVMIAIPPLILYFRKPAACYHFVSCVALLFYCCYLTYIFLPVCGPRIFWFEYSQIINQDQFLVIGQSYPFPEQVKSALFYKIMLFIYDHFEAVGAAFPSSHIAVAWCTVYLSFVYLKSIKWLHATVAILLTLSTIYGRYHYVVDVIGGIALAIILVPIINWLYRISSSKLPEFLKQI